MKEQVATAVMGQHDCCSAWRASRWSAAALILCCFMLVPWQGALAESNSASVPCPGKPNCVMLVVDGTIQSVPPIFRAAVTNTSINEILLAGPRYVLRPTSWTVYSQQQPYRLTRNLTVRGLQGWSVMDFSLIEKKVLIASGVTVKFQNLVLANIRKLGGFGLDFFMGEAGSAMVLMDSIRVKPACQLPTDVFRSAQSFQRISPAFPNNEVKLVPKFCFTAALSSPEPQQQCFTDALQMTHFSLMAVYNDPDKGSQFPGYTLYHDNVTRVCQSTITKKCLEDTNGDEELCMAMLVAASGIAGQPSRQTGPQGGGYHWSPGAAAGVAIAGGTFVLILFLMYILRRKLFRSCLHKQQHKKLEEDPEAGLNRFDDPTHVNLNHSLIPSYTGGRAISQQVTLTTLLGAGSFGRVYRGRWHSSDVAIKIIVVRTPEELPKVLKEAEVMLQLDHPNIVRAFHASVWNPSEQVKATREARNSSSSSAKTASAGAAVDVPTAAAAAAGAAPDTSVVGGRKNAVRRNSSSLRPAGAAGVGPVSPSAPAAVAVPAATASGNHVTTPSVSSEQRQPQTQSLTSSTHINTDSSQVAGRTGQLASSGHLAAAAADVVAAGPSKGANGLTGWLQIIPSQQQQQPRGGIAHASSASADCASTMYADVGGRSGQQGTDGTSLVGPASPGRDAAQLQQLARSATDGVLDTSGQPFAAQGKRVQQPSQHSVSSLQQPSQHSVSSLQQPSVPAQQQQQAGGLRRHLLSGWRNRPPKGSTSSPGNSSSTLASPRAAAAAAAVAAAAAAGSGSGPRSSSQDGCTSGPHSGASSAGLMSSGGAVAIMHTPEVAIGSTHGSRRSAAASQPSWASSGSKSGHAREEEAKKAQCEQQVWIILELCTGGTLLDAALSGRFKLAGSDQQQQQQPPGTSRLEMAKLLSRLLDAANGMAYLHARGIMHGDLKAGNVLLQHSIHGSYGQIAKISDFGLSAVLLNGTTHRSTASLGTITHMAPELLRNGRMSPSADVYSFGILMWEVFCGKQAWQGLHYGVVVERVVISKERPPVPPDMPEELELLMRRCWDDDPIKRPSFEQIVECLELLLDNLGSEDGEADSIASGQNVSVRVRGVSAPAAPPDHLRVQQQPDLEHAAGLQQDLQQYQRLSAPAALAAAAVPAAFAGGAQPMQAVAAAQPAGVPAGAAAAAATQARPAAAAAVVGLPLSAHTSPSTPVHPVQVPKQQLGPYDSGLAGDTGTHGSQAHSSSSQLRSSTSVNPHSSHTANQPGSTSGRRPSVLDENVYLQDL